MRTRMLAFFAGVMFFTQLNYLPSLYWLLVVPVAWLTVVFLLTVPVKVKDHAIKHVMPRLVSGWLVLTFFVSGFGVSVYHAHEYYRCSLPLQWQSKTITVEGEIVSIPKVTGNKKSFEFNVADANYKNKQHQLGKIKLNWYRTNINLQAGQYWRLKVRLKRPYGMQNPGGFDYEQWLLQKSIVATGYVYKTDQKLLGQNNYSVNFARQKIYEKTAVELDGYPELGVILALSIGERSRLTEEQWEVFRKTGTAHLIAISGLHIGLIAGISFLLVRLGLGYLGLGLTSIPLQTIAALASIMIAFAYAALAGFSIPTIRALIMYCIFISVYIARRNTHGFDALLFALFVLLVFDPFAVLNAGFWLSFGAVFAIIYVISGRFGKSGMRARIKLLLQTQLAIYIALLPVLLLFFKQASIVSPLVNLYAVPLMSLLFIPVYLIATILLMFNFAYAEEVFRLMHFAYEIFWWILNWFANLPHATFSQAGDNIILFAIAITGVVILLFRGRITHKWIGVILIFPVLAGQKHTINSGDGVVSFLDVGQGAAVVVATSNHAMVFDAGARFSSGFDMGRLVVYPFIKKSNYKIDKLIISHGDNDHIGGAQYLLSNLDINSVESSVPDKLQPYSNNLVEACQSGKSWQWDGVKFSYLSPDDSLLRQRNITHPKNAMNENNLSCVLRIDFNDFSVLLTGDIQKETEYKLSYLYGEKLKANILMVPHHGSNTSSVAKFIELVDPDYAVITVGHLNRYRLPNKKVLRRYAQYSSARVLETAKTGMIQFHIQHSFQLHKHIADIKLYRQNMRGFWLHNK